MAKKKKYYVIWEGAETGIFDTWGECQLHIKGYPNARYKSFTSREEAAAAYHGNSRDYIKSGIHKASSGLKPTMDKSEVIWESMAVDAACSGNPGVMEYRGVDTKTGFEYFKKGPFQRGTNNIGEFLAIVHALALLKKEGKDDLVIYTDSRTAMSWVRRKTVKTTLTKTAQNAFLFELMDRAVSWLKNNSYSNPIIKWETKKWGEIPADFGRK